jgi:hypothetical protein
MTATLRDRLLVLAGDHPGGADMYGDSIDTTDLAIAAAKMALADAEGLANVRTKLISPSRIRALAATLDAD